MKNIILGLTIFLTLSCKAQQILPIEDAYIYIENQDVGIPENITHIKDVNHLLDKYVGTWIGSYDNKTIELRVVSYTENSYGILWDELKARYKITDIFGNIILDTTSLPNDNQLVCFGDYLDPNGSTYRMYYVGYEQICGQEGSMWLDIDINNLNTLRMLVHPDVDMINLDDCPNGEAEHIMPMDFITLNKL